MSGNLAFGIELFGQGVANGLMYSLVALGFVLIYKATDAINFAQGEFVMIAGIVISAFASQAYGFPLWIALFIGLVFMIVFNIGLERVVLRPLIGRPIVSIIMATIGLAFILRGFGPMVFGSAPRPINLSIPDVPIIFGPFFFTPMT